MRKLRVSFMMDLKDSSSLSRAFENVTTLLNELEDEIENFSEVDIKMVDDKIKKEVKDEKEKA